MQDRTFMYLDLKYDQIVELLEKLGFQVCDDEWNQEVKNGMNNTSKSITHVPFMVRLGNANIEVPQGVDEKQPFKLLVSNYYLQPSWPNELFDTDIIDTQIITTEWAKLMHEIYGENYDNFYLGHYNGLRQNTLAHIQKLKEKGYIKFIEHHKSKLMETEQTIAEYNEFLSQCYTM